jgi:TetR/AcrR family transcriptional regulator, transcriptional repressor for nem operon
MAKPDVRERLLTAGLEALHKRGFNATGVQDITDAAKVPKGSFYNHFESKDALGVEVVQRWSAKAAERRRALVEGSGKPLVRLRAYFKALNELGPATGFARGCLMGNFSAELSTQSPAIRAALEAGFDGWTKEVAQVVAEAQKAGDVSKDLSASALAGFLIDAWEGAVLRSRVEKGAAALDAFLAVAFNKILT